VDGPTAFSSGEPVPNSSFSRTFDHPGTFIVSSDGAPGSQGVVVVVKNGSQVATPTLAQYIANTVPVVYTVHLHCLTDDVDMIYTLDGSYPSLQNDLAEMYDPDVGIVFESPGAYLIRALASKEDMMPSEVMTSRLFFVSEETKQVEAVKHVADSSIEVEEAEGTPQLGSETQEVDSLQVGPFCAVLHVVSATCSYSHLVFMLTYTQHCIQTPPLCCFLCYLSVHFHILYIG
jgi:hypothetical protein